MTKPRTHLTKVVFGRKVSASFDVILSVFAKDLAGGEGVWEDIRNFRF
jgi:hypothetical protein